MGGDQNMYSWEELKMAVADMKTKNQPYSQGVAH